MEGGGRSCFFNRGEMHEILPGVSCTTVERTAAGANARRR